MNRLSDDKRKKGCPTCGGIDPKTCMRCYGKTRMYDWVKDGESYDYARGAYTDTRQAPEEVIMCKEKAEKRIRRKVAKAKPCPFCGKIPVFDIRTDDKISERGSFGHYAKMEPCCRVLGCGRTELFFTNNFKKPDYGLWSDMAIRLITDWNTRAGAQNNCFNTKEQKGA